MSSRLLYTNIFLDFAALVTSMDKSSEVERIRLLFCNSYFPEVSLFIPEHVKSVIRFFGGRLTETSVLFL